ncbi:MAG: hypothetical protein FWE70_05560 [Oscillospiraceae bacterium]|nr:hypothetical protein [Oscillospiraceae bacterium]
MVGRAVRRILDAALLPKSFYMGLSPGPGTVVPCTAFAGAAVAAPIIAQRYGGLFVGPNAQAAAYNLAMAVVALMLAGGVSVMFLGVPAHGAYMLAYGDLARDHRGTFVRMTKVCAASVCVRSLPDAASAAALMMGHGPLPGMAAARLAFTAISCASLVKGAYLIGGILPRHVAPAFALSLAWSLVLGAVTASATELTVAALFVG